MDDIKPVSGVNYADRVAACVDSKYKYDQNNQDT